MSALDTQALVPTASTALSSMTPADLADTINSEHHQAADAVTTALVHAIRAGEALIQARERVPGGTWQAWVDAELDLSPWATHTYIRLATYSTHLQGHPSLSIGEALNHLRGLPPSAGFKVFPDEMRDRIKRMHSDGAGPTEIAELFGISRGAVRKIVDREYSARESRRSMAHKRRSRAARRALREKEARESRQAAVKRAGGSIADAYSNVRKLAAAIERAADEADGRSLADTLRRLNRQVFEVEDAIVTIIGEAG